MFFFFFFFFKQSKLLCKIPKKANFGENLQRSKFWWKFSKKTNYWWNFSNKSFCLTIFQLNLVLWKCSNKATFLRKFSNKAHRCGNFPAKQSLVEIFYKGNFFCGNLPYRHFLVEISHKGNFLWKFHTRGLQFLWNFLIFL